MDFLEAEACCAPEPDARGSLDKVLGIADTD